MDDPDNRPCLHDFFKNQPTRLFHIGRLDKDSEGLLLLTDDGDLTHKATHPSFGLTKRYLVQIEGVLGRRDEDEVKNGVELDDGLARVDSIKKIRQTKSGDSWYEVDIHEGRYHIIRRLMEAVGVEVIRLVRSQFGPILLGDMKEGRWRDLNEVEMANLYKALDLKP